jgi:hypothetical protein
MTSSAQSADLITEDARAVLEQVVARYLGESEKSALERSYGSVYTGRALVNAASALTNAEHTPTGYVVGDVLPPGTTDFVRGLATRIGEKIPLPWEVKIQAVARGFQVIGIYLGDRQGIAAPECARLLMTESDRPPAVFRERIDGLIEQAAEDLGGRLGSRAPLG